MKPEFALGQPVIGTWDGRGTSLGRITERIWIEKTFGVPAFWLYTVQQSNHVYHEMEEMLEPCKVDKDYLKENLKVVA